MVQGGDAVGADLIANSARPRGSITGLTLLATAESLAISWWRTQSMSNASQQQNSLLTGK
jgi:hypothetical protein